MWNHVIRNDLGWRKWFDESEPENCPVPEYEDRIVVLRNLGPFIRLALRSHPRGRVIFKAAANMA